MEDVTAFDYKEAKLQELLEKHITDAKMALAQQVTEELARLQSSNSKSGKQSQS